jgi:hypothetical protein
MLALPIMSLLWREKMVIRRETNSLINSSLAKNKPRSPDVILYKHHKETRAICLLIYPVLGEIYGCYLLIHLILAKFSGYQNGEDGLYNERRHPAESKVLSMLSEALTYFDIPEAGKSDGHPEIDTSMGMDIRGQRI